jgi:purine-binding chemotaxis protein CheW
MDKSIDPQKAIMDYLSELLPVTKTPVPVEPEVGVPEPEKIQELKAEASTHEVGAASPGTGDSQLGVAEDNIPQPDGIKLDAQENVILPSEMDDRRFHAVKPTEADGTSAMPLSAEGSQLYHSRKQSLAAQRQMEKRKQWPDQSLPVREPIPLNPIDILPRTLPKFPPVSPEPEQSLPEKEAVSPELEAKRKARSEKARANHLARVAARKQKLAQDKIEQEAVKQEVVKKTTEAPVVQTLSNVATSHQVEQAKAPDQIVAPQPRVKIQTPQHKPSDNLTPNKDTLIEVAPPDGWLPNGRPDWGQARFECLLFTVAGLKLAVPLVTLGAIHTIDKELTPIVGRPSWYLGMFPVHERNVNVVDTARFVMPERIQADTPHDYNYAIRLDASDWAMGCHTVEQSIRLSPDDVKWRSNRGKRPWLAGTVVEYMCALMDVRALCRMFDESAGKPR